MLRKLMVMLAEDDPRVQVPVAGVLLVLSMAATLSLEGAPRAIMFIISILSSLYFLWLAWDL